MVLFTHSPSPRVISKRFLGFQPQKEILAVYELEQQSLPTQIKLQNSACQYLLQHLFHLATRISATTDTNYLFPIEIYSSFDKATQVLWLKVSKIKAIKFMVMVNLCMVSNQKVLKST